MQKGEYANCPYSLSKGIEKFVVSIRFSTMLIETQRDVLKEIKTLKNLEKLTIHDCEGLNDKFLRELVEELPTLKTLDLVRCPQITPAGIEAANLFLKLRERKVMIMVKRDPIKEEKSKKEELVPHFKQFSTQLNKSEKAAGKEEEILQESPKKAQLNAI